MYLIKRFVHHHLTRKQLRISCFSEIECCITIEVVFIIIYYTTAWKAAKLMRMIFKYVFVWWMDE